MSELILDEEKRVLLKGAVDEMVGSHYRAQAEKDLQLAICNRMKDEIEMPPKIFRKLAKTAYDDSAKKQNDELTVVLDLAEELGFYSHNEED